MRPELEHSAGVHHVDGLTEANCGWVEMGYDECDVRVIEGVAVDHRLNATAACVGEDPSARKVSPTGNAMAERRRRNGQRRNLMSPT
jgi:hypothetical protein